VALMLQKKGITRVRPLAGGIDAWLAQNFPVEMQISASDAALALTSPVKLGAEGN